jgi:hypothetical protein
MMEVTAAVAACLRAHVADTAVAEGWGRSAARERAAARARAAAARARAAAARARAAARTEVAAAVAACLRAHMADTAVAAARARAAAAMARAAAARAAVETAGAVAAAEPVARVVRAVVVVGTAEVRAEVRAA